MLKTTNIRITTCLMSVTLAVLFTVGFNCAIASDATDPPARCAGYGVLQSISLTNWETGLDSWTVGTYGVIDPTTFDTPDWAIVGNLPDSRSGSAAFVENLVAGDCVLDDESGALTLDSPPMVIPGGIQVPRISIDHWLETDFGWDGGNFKISVNGSAFNLIPASAIEVGPYNDTLFTAFDEFGYVFNSNPLADQDAFTQTVDGHPTGSWIQSRINLLGIAAAGDTVELRLDFGVNACTAVEDDAIGWYVDNVEFYSCEAELTPSNCGNGVINESEQCDDGNDFISDGCSNTCEIETGWTCTDPTPPGTINDPSFEDGTPNPSWTEVSNKPSGTPICEVGVCNMGGGTGPSDGSFWVSLGSSRLTDHESSVSQSVVIPATVTDLTFDFEASKCDSASDYVEVLIDGTQELLIDGSSPLCGVVGYATQAVDISTYADGGTHDLEFRSATFSNNGNFSNFSIDVIAMPGSTSFCRREGTNLTLVKEIINDDDGTASTSDWILAASGPTPFSDMGPSVSNGEGFLPGTYDLSESGGPAGYSASDWVCDGGTQLDGDTINLALDEAATCTITNDDIAPTLTVVKTITNDSGGGILDPDSFGLKLDSLGVLHNAVNAVDFGDHTVSEIGLPGYVAGAWGGDCGPDGSVTLALGESATCTITNDDDGESEEVIFTNGFE